MGIGAAGEAEGVATECAALHEGERVVTAFRVRAADGRTCMSLLGRAGRTERLWGTIVGERKGRERSLTEISSSRRDFKSQSAEWRAARWTGS